MIRGFIAIAVPRLWRLLLAAGLLAVSVVSHGEVTWPVSDRTMGETRDLIHHLVSIAPTAVIEDRALAVPAWVARFYRERNFAPAWFDRNGVYLEVGDLLEALRQAPLEGLPGGNYHLATLERWLAQAAEEPLQLAQLDLLLTDAALLYSRDLRAGRTDPLKVDPDWQVAPPQYDFPALLRQALSDRRLAAFLAELPPSAEGYRRLRMALARYRAVERRGGWQLIPEGQLLKRGVRDARIALLRWRLAGDGDLSDKPVRDELLFDLDLDRALRRFQRRQGLDIDGKVGPATLAALNVPLSDKIRQLILNMERWRWMPREYARRYVLVNMAGFELSLMEEGRPIHEMRVIIGRDQRQTPAMSSFIDTLVLNPYWFVPPTVLEQDLLPVLSKDPGYLTKMNMKVFSSLQGQGKEVNPAGIHWEKYKDKPFPYTIRQEPGPANALGRLKFLFPNDQGIYLHDTPNRGLFARQERAFSSGCIRVEDPVQLATLLLEGEDAWDNRAIQTALEEGQPRQVKLKHPVSIYLVYWTAWVNELNELHFRSDIYERDSRLAEALGLH